MDPGQRGDRDRLEAGLEQLRALGYLQSPAELFVARRVPARGGAARAASAAGLWVGAGGGALLALLLWGTSLLASPGLLDRPAECAALLALLVSALACAGAMVVALLAWPLLAWAGLSRRAQPARPVLLLLTVVLVGCYVADAVGRHLLVGLARPLWPAAVLVVAASAATLAMWAARLLSAMVAAAGARRASADGRWLPGPARASIFWMSGFAVALALLGFGPYQALRPQLRLDELPAPAVLEPSSPTLLVIAIEGLARADVDASQAGVELRALPQLLERAAPLSTTGAAEHPAAFWNEVATGQPAERHGLSDAAAALPLGVDGGIAALGKDPVWSTLSRHVLPGVGLARTRAADQRELLLPPVWEIAARAGRPSMAVNWWATYPAARHPQLQVATDRWFLRLWEAAPEALEDPLLRYPDELAAMVLAAGDARAGAGVDPAWAVTGGIAVARGDSLLDSAVGMQPEAVRRLRAAWRLSTRADAFHARLAVQALAAPARPNLIMLHLNGLDIFDRQLRAAAGEWAGDPALARLAPALRDLEVAAIDALLAAALQRAQEQSARLLVIGSASRGKVRTAWVCAAAAASGPPLPATMLEVAPTVLAEIGVAPAADMARPAHARGGAWDLSRPSTFGRRPAWTPRAPRTPEDLETLRSLGYIGGD